MYKKSFWQGPVAMLEAVGGAISLPVLLPAMSNPD
jgi:hypothetical protein